ncbi:MAG: amino acid ABC transporter ATP-binding protein [Fimbriiglobus sp.]
MIRITDLVKSFGPTRVLDGISLTFGKGEVAALIGPSGGGKSTLLRCINALESFDAGEITVDDLTLTGGASPPRADLLKLRRRVGMVFQQFHLFPHMTVLKNVMAGPVHALGVPAAEAEATAKKWLDRVGMGHKLDARPSTLSGGQQQRVAIARALAVNPVAILFDEPTSALDPKMSAEVMAVIDALADDEQFQAAMLIVTHDIPAMRKIADTVHILDKGRVAYSGPVAEAFAPGGPADNYD